MVVRFYWLSCISEFLILTYMICGENHGEKYGDG